MSVDEHLGTVIGQISSLVAKQSVCVSHHVIQMMCGMFRDC